jgi:hypothetical protein
LLNKEKFLPEAVNLELCVSKSPMDTTVEVA